MNVRQTILLFSVGLYLFHQFEAHKLKFQKSFDEIFGHGWADKKKNNEQNQHAQRDHEAYQRIFDQNFYFMAQEKLRKQLDDLFDDNFCDEKEENDDDEAEEDTFSSQKSDRQEEFLKNIAKPLSIEGDQQKREIINEFHKMKNDFLKRGASANERNKIEAQILKELGVSRHKIFKWKKELGKTGPKIYRYKYSEEEKREILRKFDEKLKLKIQKNNSTKRTRKIVETIARKLDVSATSIYKWKKKFTKSFELKDDEKRKIIKKYLKLKNDFKKERQQHSQREWHQFQANLKQTIGFGHRTILRWRKEFGMTTCHCQVKDNSTKMTIIHKYNEMKNEFMSKREHTRKEWQKFDRRISDKLGVSRVTISKWRKKLEQK